MQKRPNKANPSFAAFEQSFAMGSPDSVTLLQKELTVNHAEQTLLKKRMHLMREFINDLPSSDPQYSMIATAIEMDQIELDELQRRSHSILQMMEGM